MPQELQLRVSGFKSIRNELSVPIRPLTVLAGPNSSGKSSIMQPLLLAKQTLEAPYDPGALLLDGPNVRFTSTKQFLSRNRDEDVSGFSMGIQDGEVYTEWFFTPGHPSRVMDIARLTIRDSNSKKDVVLRPGMSHDEIIAAWPEHRELFRDLLSMFSRDGSSASLAITRDRCFLEIRVKVTDKGWRALERWIGPHIVLERSRMEHLIRRVIHVPGLRGNPERIYRKTAVEKVFPGTFDNYVASLLAAWKPNKNSKQLKRVQEGLTRLGLTSKVDTRPREDTQVEILVARPPRLRRGAPDMVSIADVGFGVSQALPVLVALAAADQSHLVYIEQPEIHLHPKAQYELAWILGEAVNRGCRVVIETHSSILLRGIQTMVARGELPHKQVALNWFSRDDDGVTTITTGDLDEKGAFGSWPVDFDEVALMAEADYLRAGLSGGN